MASEASLIVMYGVTVWNPSGMGLTSPLMCPLSRLTLSNAIRVYAQTAWFPYSVAACPEDEFADLVVARLSPRVQRRGVFDPPPARAGREILVSPGPARGSGPSP